jgi:hypothetical protein
MAGRVRVLEILRPDGNFSRGERNLSRILPGALPANFPGIVAAARASELPRFFLPREWNFQHMGASVTV